jgi:putative membrane protein (TIGR04086 family)
MNRRRYRAVRALIRGVITAVAATLIGMLILSAAIIFIGMGDGLLRALNQVLKIASVALGAFLGVGRGGDRGLVTGAGIGAVYALAGYALYALLGEGGFSVAELLGELLIAIAAGATAGAVFANMQGARKQA